MPYTRNMLSREYWLERSLDRDRALKKTEDEVIAQVNRLYKRALIDSRQQLNDFYNKYAVNNSLSLQEAQQLLTPIELIEYQDRLSRLKSLYQTTQSPYILEEINMLTSRAYVTRQMALIDSINMTFIETSHNVQMTIQDYLEGTYVREYEDTLKSLNIAPHVTPVNAVKEIINYPYAGAQFSDRIWRNKRTLLNYINDDLTTHLIKGSSIKAMSKDLMDRTNTLYFQAARLVRTEANYAMNQGHLNGYSDAGIEQYEVLAHLDQRTSSICRRKHKQIYDMSEALVGSTMPPFHPNCRTTIIPIIKEIEDNNESTSNNNPNRFKNNKEAAQYLKDKYDFETVSFGNKIDTEVASTVINEIDKVYDRYPQLKGFTRRFKSNMDQSAYGAFAYGLDKNGPVLDLKMSSVLMNNISDVTKSYNGDLAKNFHPQGTTWKDIMTHEYGHVIECFLTAKKYNINPSYETISRLEMRQIFNAYQSHTVADEILEEVFNNLGLYEIKDKGNAIRNLSSYALKSKGETIAEAFADAMSNGDNAQPISKEILKIIDREMNK